MSQRKMAAVRIFLKDETCICSVWHFSPDCYFEWPSGVSLFQPRTRSEQFLHLLPVLRGPGSTGQCRYDLGSKPNHIAAEHHCISKEAKRTGWWSSFQDTSCCFKQSCKACFLFNSLFSCQGDRWTQREGWTKLQLWSMWNARTVFCYSKPTCLLFMKNMEGTLWCLCPLLSWCHCRKKVPKVLIIVMWLSSHMAIYF